MNRRDRFDLACKIVGLNVLLCGVTLCLLVVRPTRALTDLPRLRAILAESLIGRRR